MNYGRALKVARAIAGLQQKELARAAGLDPSHVSLIEMGKRKPSVSALEKLANALGVPLHLLTILGSEAGDLKHIHPDDFAQLGQTLTRLLVADGISKIKSRRRVRHPA